MDDEFTLIDSLLRAYDAPVASALLLGPGDDAALWQPGPDQALAITTDTLLAGRHIPTGAPPEFVAFRALAMNLSDVAAMGATPGAFVVALTLPESDVIWMQRFGRGLAALAREAGATLAGGNLSRGALSVTITALGEVPPTKALRRGGAQVGDDIYVSGSIGLAAQGLAAASALVDWPRFDDLLTSTAPLARYLLPRPRVALGQRLRGRASACVDVSDGLLADLGHLCAASRLHAALDAGLLSAAVVGDLATSVRAGDDYELCFAVPPAHAATVVSVGRDLGLPLTRIGRLEPGHGVAIDGVGVTAGGYRHF